VGEVDSPFALGVELKFADEFGAVEDAPEEFEAAFELGGFAAVAEAVAWSGVLCRRAQRRLKEEAMVSSDDERFLAAASALGKSIEKGVFKRAAIIERKSGALQKRHARNARLYTLKHTAGRLEITRDDEKMKSVLAQYGDPVLKTNKSLGAAQLWELYMPLLKAEAGFGELKGPLGLRPNFHQLENRVSKPR